MQNKCIALVCAGAILLLAACGGAEALPTATPLPPPTEAPLATLAPTAATPARQASTICAAGTLPAWIKQVVTAKGAEGANFTPVDITDGYQPTQRTFHAVTTLENAPANTILRAVWYLVQAEGYQPNTKIDENELSVEQGGSRNVDFTLETNNDRWPPGAYCVEIYADGNLALSKSFRVADNREPSRAGTGVVKQIVLAQDTQPESFEPVNPTTRFKSNARFIHAAVQIENAPANTVFRARWYPPNQEPLAFELTVDGTRWLDFRLTPAPEGFPTGEYKVEIYVNDQLVDTKSFAVE